MKQPHFRERSPEEDISLVGRRAHSFGPMGAAVLNTVGYATFGRNHPELLVAGVADVGVSLAAASYVAHRIRRGVSYGLELPVGNRQPSRYERAKQFVYDKIVPAVGVTALASAAESAVLAISSNLDAGHPGLAVTANTAAAATVVVGLPAVGLTMWKDRHGLDAEDKLTVPQAEPYYTTPEAQALIDKIARG